MSELRLFDDSCWEQRNSPLRVARRLLLLGLFAKLVRLLLEDLGEDDIFCVAGDKLFYSRVILCSVLIHTDSSDLVPVCRRERLPGDSRLGVWPVCNDEAMRRGAKQGRRLPRGCFSSTNEVDVANAAARAVTTTDQPQPSL